MLNIAISASADDASIVVRVEDGENSRTILRGSLAELKNDAERQSISTVLAAVQAFVASQE